MYAELMGRHRRMREGNDYLWLRGFPIENITLTHYTLSTWWLHLLDGLGNYVIRLGAIEQVLVMTNNKITIGCNFYKCRLKNQEYP